MRLLQISFLISFLIILSCTEEHHNINEWVRIPENPVFRDIIPDINYEVASDGHVFYDETGKLRMIYSGDANGNSSIKLATASSLINWERTKPLLFEKGPSGKDIQKETSFYRKSNTGKHQIYYIGYPDDLYEAEIYLAEADHLEGPYIQQDEPIIKKGEIAGKEVYCITSPSIMEYQEKLYIAFIGWNDHPGSVTEVWVLGAISEDDGHTWTDFQEVETPIGMEGQVTQIGEEEFIAVRTGEYKEAEAIFYATSKHPFDHWDSKKDPILIKNKSDLEVDEIIAPQIFVDKETGKQSLFYTGAEHAKGWWMMLAEKD